MLWDEAPQTILAGVQLYSWGLYCAIGAFSAAAGILVLCCASGTKKGTGILLAFLSVVFGIAASRLLYCLLSLPGGMEIPFAGWFDLTSGGYSMFGMIFGVFLAAACCAKITGEKPRLLLDIVSCSIPLFISAERIGERVIEGFNVSRPVMNRFPAGTFLGLEDPVYGTSVLATWLVGAILSMILFLVLALMLLRKERRDGDQLIVFLLLCGAGGVILESLRYDYHMEYSFVYFQQILAALMLVSGVILAGKRGRGQRKPLFRAALISLPAAIGVCGFVEYALDRMDINQYILYGMMTAALAVPVLFGILLITRKKGKETA